MPIRGWPIFQVVTEFVYVCRCEASGCLLHYVSNTDRFDKMNQIVYTFCVYSIAAMCPYGIVDKCRDAQSY